MFGSRNLTGGATWAAAEGQKVPGIAPADDAALRSRLDLRSVGPGETLELLQALTPLHSGVSEFGSGSARPLARYVEADDDDRLAMVAWLSSAESVRRAVGVGRVRPVDAERLVATVQLFVVPDLRHRGIGSLLFCALAERAQAQGVRRVRFRLTPTQTEALGFLTRLSTLPTVWQEQERVVVEFPITSQTVDALRGHASASRVPQETL